MDAVFFTQKEKHILLYTTTINVSCYTYCKKEGDLMMVSLV